MILALLLGLLALATTAEAHTHAQCVVSKPCQDAAAAAVKKATLARDAEIARLQEALRTLQERVVDLEGGKVDCGSRVPLGSQPDWSRYVSGSVICLADGDHAFVLRPPARWQNVTIRAEHYGQASVQGIDLVENEVAIEGLRVPCPKCPTGWAVWSRKTR